MAKSTTPLTGCSMLQDLIDHIRDDSTQYQVESAKAAVYSITAIAIPVVRDLRFLLINRIEGNTDLTYDEVFGTGR